ncbi:potassium-transporting ATPase subunit KdpC [Rhodomicrobium sp.]|uniref:potassium-transporting ATPase subunit KdpC n=1 Tax=Rhodomicrobium sp. TaxID=2720632 RepID=UPI0039E4334C
MLATLRPALVMILFMTALTGIAYPLAVTSLSQAVFPERANGSLLTRDGHVVGSALIGQTFTSERYFQGRPSATVAPDPADPSKTVSAPYNAANSAGSNAGPTSKTLVDRVQTGVADYRQANGSAGPVPADAATTSASGLDPHISPANAAAQVERVATARNLPPARVRALVEAATEERTLGFLGERRVNVLLLNLALDDEQKDSQQASIQSR